MRVRPHLTYANVMVTLLAFVVLFGGGAYAASKLGKDSVGTKQLKDDAVKTAKVKDRTLKANDLAAGVIPETAHGWQANGSVNYDTFSSSSYGSNVVHLSIPPGNYYVTSSVSAQSVNDVSGDVSCRLVSGGVGPSRTQFVPRSTVGSVENFTLTALIDVTDGAIELECYKLNPSAGDRITDANIVAARIDDITGSAG